MNTQQVTVGGIYAGRSYSQNMKGDLHTAPLCTSRGHKNGLLTWICATVLLSLSYGWKYRPRSIFLYDAKKKPPQILIDDLYSTPSRNTPISLCITLGAQPLVQMTNNLAKCDFSGPDLNTWCSGEMAPG